MYRYSSDQDMSSNAEFTTTCPNPNCREVYQVGRPHECRNLKPAHVRWDDGTDVHPVIRVSCYVVLAIIGAASIGYILSAIANQFS